MAAIDIFFKYLTETPVAPLQRDMVEIDEPYCNDVRSTYNMITILTFRCNNIVRLILNSNYF